MSERVWEKVRDKVLLYSPLAAGFDGCWPIISGAVAVAGDGDGRHDATEAQGRCRRGRCILCSLQIGGDSRVRQPLAGCSVTGEYPPNAN